MLLIEADGRQPDFSVGIPFGVYNSLAKELNFEDAFIVDGGGSATMVQLVGDGYQLINRPSDKKSDGTYGSPRVVVNSVILAAGPDRNAPQPTEVPPESTDEPAATGDDSNVTENPQSGNSSAGPGSSSESPSSFPVIPVVLGIGSAVLVGIVAGTVVILKKKNKS